MESFYGGRPGKNWAIVKSYITSYETEPKKTAKAQMDSEFLDDATFDEIPDKSYVIVTEVDEEGATESCKLYRRNGKAAEEIADLKGAQGVKGDKGNTGTYKFGGCFDTENLAGQFAQREGWAVGTCCAILRKYATAYTYNSIDDSGQFAKLTFTNVAKIDSAEGEKRFDLFILVETSPTTFMPLTNDAISFETSEIKVKGE